MMFVQYSSLLLFSAVVVAGNINDGDSDPQPPATTPPPQLKGNLQQKDYYGVDLIGYEAYSGYWYAATCGAGYKYVTSGTVGQCCPNSASYCTYATACRGNDAIYANGASGNCGTNKCDAATVMASRGAPEWQIQTLVRCFDTEQFHNRVRTYYRATYPLTTSSATQTQKETVTVVQTVRPTSSPDSGHRQAGVDGAMTTLWVVLSGTVVFAIFIGMIQL